MTAPELVCRALGDRAVHDLGGRSYCFRLKSSASPSVILSRVSTSAWSTAFTLVDEGADAPVRPAHLVHPFVQNVVQPAQTEAPPITRTAEKPGAPSASQVRTTRRALSSRFRGGNAGNRGHFGLPASFGCWSKPRSGLAGWRPERPEAGPS
jgi:hypothetical protein